LSEHLLLTLHAFATLYMTGLIWFVQIVHYPLMKVVAEATGPEAFAAYEKLHQSRTSLAVGPPMLVEGLTAIALAANPPAEVHPASPVIGAAVLAAIWVSTGAFQMREHARLARGFDAAAHRRLVLGNWFRSVAWTLRGALALYLAAVVFGGG
jgi:hypothetical protein